MKTQFTQEKIKETAILLGIPEHPFFQRRIARAFDLVANNKVFEITDDIYRVRSQYDADKSYIVNLNHGEPSCDCLDNKKHGVACKHLIASMLVALEARPNKLTIYDDTFDRRKSRHGKRNSKYGRWIVNDYKVRKGYVVYRDEHDKLHCACGKKHCRHCKAIRKVTDDGKKIVNECGTLEGKLLQDKLNGDNGKAGDSQPSTYQLDVTNPFQESEQMDIDQIEGRSNGNLAHKLSNGEYVISYRAIMKLASQHSITFEASRHDETNTVVVYGHCGNNSRVSGKPINGSETTAIELAKRNAARQLLPLPEIKALEHKVKLEASFSWENAKSKCIDVVPDYTLSIIIDDMVKAGALRQVHISDYNRKEFLAIYDACKRDVETNGNENNGDGFDPSPDRFAECRVVAKDFVRFQWLKSDILKENLVSDEWKDADIEKLKSVCEIDASLFGKGIGDWTLDIEPNHGKWAYQRRYRFWLTPMSKRCFWCGKPRKESILPDTMIYWGRYEIKVSLCLECSNKVADGELDKDRIVQKFDEKYRAYGGVGRSNIFPDNPETVPSTESDMVDDTTDDANSKPLENGNGKRRLEMDKKLKTWLVEVDGSKTEISCREICEQFNGNIVMRLRSGIESGGDISAVEVD